MLPLIDSILGKFSSDLAVDLGTANTLIYVAGKGIVVREPSIVALNKRTKNVLAIGSEAKKMVGKTPANIICIRPLKDGVISDWDTTYKMLDHFVKKIHNSPGRRIIFSRPRIGLSTPSGVTEVERRALIELAMACGAREAFLVEEPMAAAIGAGLPVLEPVGSMIVDIGGGTSEIAVISLGGIVASRTLKIGGDELDLAIINYVRTRHALAIGEKTAEQLKILLGSAFAQGQEKEMVIRGRDLEKGLPKSVRVNSNQVREALAEPFNTIVDAIVDTLEDTPPELTSDIAERGIVISGGGALISGFAKLISTETKMPVVLAENPLNCVVVGCARVLNDKILLKRVKVGIKN